MTLALTSATSEPYRPPQMTSRERIKPWIAKEMAGIRVEALGPWATSDLDGFEEIPHPSKILRERSEFHHQTGELYEDILEKDDFLSALYAKLWDAVLALEWFVDPATDQPNAVRAADLGRHSLTTTRGLEDIFMHLCGARPMGLAVVEKIWDVEKVGEWRGAITPVAMFDRPMKRFAFRRGDRALAVRHLSGEKRFVVAPAGKFAAVRRGSLDTPWGSPELDKHYWTSWMTQHGAVYWSLAVERYADPIPEVRYPYRQGATNANQGLQKLATAALDALNQGKGVSIPAELETRLHEVSSSGGMSYPEYMAYWNRIKALRILAEIRTSGLHQGHGSYAAEETSKSLFVETVKLAALRLAKDVKDEFLAPLTQVNFGPGVAVPNFRIDVSDADDRRLRMEGLELARELRLDEVPEDQAYRIAGVPRAKPGQKTLAWPEDAAAFPARPEVSGASPDPSAEPEDAGQPITASQQPLQLAAGPDAAARWRAFDALVEAVRPGVLGHWSAQQEALVGAFADGGLQSGEAYGEIFAPEISRRQAERLHATSVHGLGLGLQQLAGEGLGPRTWRVEAPEGRAADLLLDTSAGSLRLSQAPDAGSLRDGDSAAAWWAERLGVPRDVFLGLEDALRRLAFTVAGIEDVRLLGAVHQLVGEGLAEGWDRASFRERLAALYGEHGLAPTRPWHADLILQNAASEAAGAIRWQQTVGNPAAHRLIPYLRFDTVEDTKVRQRKAHDHDVMAGRVFAIGHRIWRTWWTPAGHGCRCWITPILSSEARRLGLVGDQPTGPWPGDRHGGGGQALPDPGFRGAGNPGGFAEVQRALDEQLRTAVTEARAVRGADHSAPRFTSALAALVRLLLGRQLLRLLGLEDLL